MSLLPSHSSVMPPCSPEGCRLIAADVAVEFCRCAEIQDEDDIEWHLDVACAVGIHLADLGVAGDWTRIHMQALARQISGVYPRDDFFVTLSSMLIWLYLDGWLAADVLRRHVDRMSALVDASMPRTAAYLEACLGLTHPGRSHRSRRDLLRRRVARARRWGM